MSKLIKLVSNNGFGWRIGKTGLKIVKFKTKRNLAWNVTESSVPADAVVMNNSEIVTNDGITVTNGA